MSLPCSLPIAQGVLKMMYDVPPTSCANGFADLFSPGPGKLTLMLRLRSGFAMPTYYDCTPFSISA